MRSAFRWSGVFVFPVIALALAGCGSEPENYTVDPSASAGFPEGPGEASWPRWGGPAGNFALSSAADLAPTWQEPPRQIWSRELGAGYSAVVSGRSVLITMNRDGDEDVVSALRADDGSRIWDYRYAAPTREDNALQFGSGPNSTPLLLGDRVVTLGYTGILNCLALETGELLWSHDVIEDLGGEVLQFGNSASPIVHDGKVIVLVGGDRGAVAAFEPASGELAWRSAGGTVSYATPIVIDVEGQQQLVYFSADEIVGLDAATGRWLWSHPCENQYLNNATGPIWNVEDRLLWVATQLDGGTRVLRLSLSGEETDVEEVWSSNKISIHYWNAIRLGDHVYASIGGQGSVLACVDVKTGEILWRERGFEQVNFVQAGELTIMLDAGGNLALATLSPDGLTVHSRHQIVDEVTWTPPTLVGSTLYIRDQKSIRALDLGA